jgi:hypothetical protein
MTGAEDITRALGGKWHGRYGTACCPAHDDSNPSLRLKDGETTVLVTCYAGCEPRAVITALRERGLLPNSDSRGRATDTKRRATRPAAPVCKLAETQADSPNTRHAQEIWRRSIAIENTPADLYLRSRGLRGPFPPTLRYHAALKHGPTGLLLPAMVAAVTRWPSREVIAVHRTFLTHDGRGKAQVSEPKLSLGSIGGGAVRLAPAAETMAVAEGVETGLSFQQMTDTPTWAALNAGGIEQLVLPPLPLAAEVTIACDNDRDDSFRGEQAAERAARKWTIEGRRVRIMLPGIDGQDFNDVLRESAEYAR